MWYQTSVYIHIINLHKYIIHSHIYVDNIIVIVGITKY